MAGAFKDDVLTTASQPCRLLIFARAPEVGKAKTRLIPALGPERATELHVVLTQRTLTMVKRFIEESDVRAEVWWTSDSLDAPPSIFEQSRLPCRLQVGANLGDRMANALAAGFVEGDSRVIIIGTDCPEIDQEILDAALRSLDQTDVVLGPALDGGYYLIGLRCPQPCLFQNIDWSTEHVLRQTLTRCVEAGLSFHQLRPLGDIDNPEDLVICRRLEGDFATVLPEPTPNRVSVIIPTLNEEAHLAQTLQPLLGRKEIEVIVSDGGSNDRTVTIARDLGVQVIRSRRGRGCQLNTGAALATGATLLFLHADTLLPDQFEESIRRILEEGAIAGAFRLRIEGSGLGLRCVEWGSNLRSRWFQCPYGDQGLFIRSKDFFELQGFPNWPLMEDYEICRRLRKVGRIEIATTAATTSGRRWMSHGVLKTTFINQFCVIAFHCGMSPTSLANFYFGRRTSARNG